MESAPVAPLPPDLINKPAGPPAKPASQKTPSNNPVIAIALAIVLALILSGLSLVSYLRSDAHRTVQVLQKPSAEVTASNATIDTTSPLKAADLDTIQAAIEKDISGINDVADFGPNELTDAALGL